MSGHNPHGRLGQPNPPWNHLQVPSFIPRQPQLAHMSNEPRPIRSSPLAWHTSAHNEAALYNYMTAATHKTPLDINPLLPAFVRPPNNTPFGSVDLSLGGSSSRNHSSASPLTLLSPPANAIESNFSNHSMLQSCGLSNDMNNQQLNCNGDNRGPPPSQLSGIPPTGPFSQGFQNTDNPHIMSSNYHPLHDSLQLVKEAIHNSLRHEAGDDLLEFHELQRAISTKSTTPTSNTTNSDPERCQTTQRSPVNATSSPLPPPPITPTQQLPPSTATNQRSPSSAQHHSTSSCSSSSSSSSSSTASSTQHDLNQSIDSLPGEDKSQTRRRSRKPIKTTRMSNNSEDGDIVTNQPSVSTHEDKTSNNLVPLEEPQTKSSPPKINDNGTNAKIWDVDKSQSCSEIALVEPTIDADRIATPATPPNNIIKENPQQSNERRKSPPIQPCQEDSETIDNIAAELAKTCHENGPKSPESATPVNSGSFALTPVTIPLVPISLTDNHTVLVNTNGLQNNIQPMEQPIENGVNGSETANSSPKVNGIDQQKSVPNDAPPSEAIFEEVENKLEEMFAGIEDDRPLFETPATPTKKPVTSKASPKKTSTPKEVEAKPPAKRKKGKVPIKKTSAAASTSKGTKGKQSKLKKTKATNQSSAADKKGKQNKDAGASSSNGVDNSKPSAVTRSGPIVHVDHSGSTHVINGTVTEEVAEVKSKLKKGFIVGHHHPAAHANDRSKIRGLHCSTLSTKYDADTTDTTWMCVFCKMGPHRLGLGDLFGPYIVSTACDDFQLSQSDPTDELFSGNHKEPGKQVQKRSLPVNAAGSSTTKKKRKLTETLPSSPPPATSQPPNGLTGSNPSPFYGMAKASDTSFEVWMHGDCAVWSSGVHIIGTRIVGLEAAVWTASGHRCVLCHQYGAMLACLHRGCKDEVHVPCARLASWQLCDDDFKSRCSLHSVKAESGTLCSANA